MIKRIMAILHKQEWAGDLAVEVGKPTAFDVTDRILAMGKDSAIALEDDDYDTDNLARELDLLDDHAGPFYVEVEESIRDYFVEKENKSRCKKEMQQHLIDLQPKRGDAPCWKQVAKNIVVGEPHCPKCDELMIRFTRFRDGRTGWQFYEYQCPKCGHKYSE